VGGTHPAFYDPEDILDGAAADRRCVGHCLEPALHLIEHRLMLHGRMRFSLPAVQRGHVGQALQAFELGPQEADLMKQRLDLD